MVIFFVFRSFSGRIQDAIICFLNFLTFTHFHLVSSLCFKRLLCLSNLDDSDKNCYIMSLDDPIKKRYNGNTFEFWHCAKFMLFQLQGNTLVSIGLFSFDLQVIKIIMFSLISSEKLIYPKEMLISLSFE